MIVDAHCHVWPDRIAPQVLAHRPAGLDPVGDGTLDGLRRVMDEDGVDMACTLAIANEARHVARTNEFIGGVDRDRFVPFGTVHTGLSVEENLSLLDANGIRAVKFHPNFQGMSLADPAVIDLFRALAERSVVVLAHVGEGSDAAASARGASEHVRTVTEQVPDLTFVACHFGGYHTWAGVLSAATGSGAYLETSWPPSLDGLEPKEVSDVIRRHGQGRVVFGSDWPMARPGRELAALRDLGLEEDALTQVTGGTLADLLGLTPSERKTPRAGSPA
ncbi:amidohydrolase family protein [Phycicoccus sp. DTK01]|uniref:amidohydrolase family protein n=1 Tax=Phycicoccus sp. DTK01 TaxID=2785745 RepID=UPI001A8D5EFA|nr:amidohydrolase family protein [Phycicoccus sp. DTK01]GIL34112.1 amidohydrolase [Phycicoccus sp. DTK01]